MSNSNKGVSRLAGVIATRIGNQTEIPLNLDFGTIKKNGTLVIDTFPVNLHKNEYIILKHCEDYLKGETVRVLIAWVEDNPVIVGVLAD